MNNDTKSPWQELKDQEQDLEEQAQIGRAHV